MANAECDGRRRRRIPFVLRGEVQHTHLSLCLCVYMNHRRNAELPERRGGMTNHTENGTTSLPIISNDVDYTNMDKDGMDGVLLQQQQQRIESHTRSLLKGLTWRVLATCTTTIIAYIITGHIDSALRIGALEFLCKLFIYYVVRVKQKALFCVSCFSAYKANAPFPWSTLNRQHERIWTHIRI